MCFKIGVGNENPRSLPTLSVVKRRGSQYGLGKFFVNFLFKFEGTVTVHSLESLLYVSDAIGAG